MIKRILYTAVCVGAMVSCSQSEQEMDMEEGRIYTTKVECAADQSLTRIYDADLNWHWEASDALVGYQMAGSQLRNTFSYSVATENFVCDAFSYMSTEPEAFHFIYPAAAEVTHGTLKAVQDGVWRPLSVATVHHATVDNLGTLCFTPISAALELRIFTADRSAPQNVTYARLSSETDFVGKWILQSDMSYTQTLEGKNLSVEGLNSSVVVFNMPHLPEGIADQALTLTLGDALGGTMTRMLPAMTFITGKRTVLNVAYSSDPVNEDWPFVDPNDPNVITGTFTCATYNVDGLPSIINSDGPGKNGTTNIGNKVAASGWDMVTFQENFEYSSQLKSPLNPYYTLGTDRGTLNYAAALIGRVSDTDGLLFATLKETCSFSNEHYETFTSAYGDLTDGANTLLKKGIRHYVVTMKDGMTLDVIVTHMNSGAKDGHINARQNQLAQIAAYINSIRSNNRPILFMGDTNCRYTRDDFKTYFWDKLDSDLVVADPWVEHSWDGVYPEYGSPALIVESKWDDKENEGEIKCSDQKGEVVDKIIYINNPNANAWIKSKSYKYDENYKGMADHWPVVSEFAYIQVKIE